MKQKVIVIGGGFAGLQMVNHLKKNHYDILLIDQLNHHQFQPLFYQVATSQIEPSSISFPFRKIFQNRQDVRIRLAEVLSVRPVDHSIQTTVGDFLYDVLIIATGCKTNFFGNNDIMRHAFSLKTTHQAITIRNAVLENFESILNSDHAEEEGLFHIVIVGGGPTGVELSGAFAEIKRDVLPKDYPRIDFSKLKIILVEGSQNTLNSMSVEARGASQAYLTAMGVVMKMGVFVRHYDGSVVTLSDGEVFRCKNLIWAAGVEGNLMDGLPPDAIANGKRIRVDRFNRVRGLDDVYAIGDIAYMETPKYPKGHPQLANVAIHQGRNLSRNLNRSLRGKTPLEYEYRDLGSMATVGRNKAVVDLPFIRFKGLLAWYVWMLLHLMLILSVRNKLIIFINWAWNYFTKNSSLRLILKSESRHSDPV